MKEKKFYITTPIYYSNDRPHIGSAYTTIAADILARWQRSKEKEVYFQTGLDEHGAKMEKASREKGFETPKSFCDQQARFWKRAWQSLNISYDFFIRTTNKSHEDFVQRFLTELWKKGEIYKGKYEGLYCIGCEEFKDASELVEGKCPLHNLKAQRITEENYFFKLSKYQQSLIHLIESDEFKIEPQERKNEVLSFLKREKLEDISISREKIEWGIQIPWDKNQTVYCWVDALLNYLSSVAEDGIWPPDIHLIGKDIIKFHAVLWPALLLANNYSLPKKIYAHGFFTLEGKKISKTQGGVVYIEDLVQKYKPDVVRFYFFREIPFGQDGDFSERALVERYNADLANNLGNLIQRVSAMLLKYFNGDLRRAEAVSKDLERFKVLETWNKIDLAIENLQFSEALAEIWQLIDRANKYIEEEKPWTDGSLREVILGNLVEVIKEIAKMLLPFMPTTSERIQNLFQGPKIESIKPLFPRIE